MLKYKRKWINDVSSQTKLENYKTVKNEFGAEEYVKLIIGKKTTSDISPVKSRVPSNRNRAWPLPTSAKKRTFVQTVHFGNNFKTKNIFCFIVADIMT